MEIRAKIINGVCQEYGCAYMRPDSSLEPAAADNCSARSIISGRERKCQMLGRHVSCNESADAKGKILLECGENCRNRTY